MPNGTGNSRQDPVVLRSNGKRRSARVFRTILDHIGSNYSCWALSWGYSILVGYDMINCNNKWQQLLGLSIPNEMVMGFRTLVNTAMIT